MGVVVPDSDKGLLPMLVHDTNHGLHLLQAKLQLPFLLLLHDPNIGGLLGIQGFPDKMGTAFPPNQKEKGEGTENHTKLHGSIIMLF